MVKEKKIASLQYHVKGKSLNRRFEAGQAVLDMLLEGGLPLRWAAAGMATDVSPFLIELPTTACEIPTGQYLVPTQIQGCPTNTAKAGRRGSKIVKAWMRSPMASAASFKRRWVMARENGEEPLERKQLVIEGQVRHGLGPISDD